MLMSDSIRHLGNLAPGIVNADDHGLLSDARSFCIENIVGPTIGQVNSHRQVRFFDLVLQQH